MTIRIIPLPDLAELQRRFRPDFAAGKLFWADTYRPAGRQRPDRQAGFQQPSGRWRVSIGGRSYLRSRILMAMATGRDDVTVLVDHVNRDVSDDRLVNLRRVSARQNNINRSVTSATGVRGVYRRPRASGWAYTVEICRSQGRRPDGGWNRVTHYYGTYSTVEEARQRYLEVIGSHDGSEYVPDDLGDMLLDMATMDEHQDHCDMVLNTSNPCTCGG